MNPDIKRNTAKHSRRPETARAAYIRLLADQCVAADAAKERDSVLCGELIDGGYLDGDKLTDKHGQTLNSALVGITVQGRLFLQELKKQERAESRFGRAKRAGTFIGGFVLGIIAKMIPDMIKAIWNLP